MACYLHIPKDFHVNPSGNVESSNHPEAFWPARRERVRINERARTERSIIFPADVPRLSMLRTVVVRVRCDGELNEVKREIQVSYV